MFHKHIYLNRIMRRRPNPKPDDYLFFHFYQTERTWKRLDKEFQTISFLAVKCDLTSTKMD